MHLFLVMFGVASNICFGAACIPMAVKCLATGRNFGIPISSAWTFLVALSAFLTYLIGTYGFDPLYVVITLIEITCWLIVILFHYWPIECRHLTRTNESDGNWTCLHCKMTKMTWKDGSVPFPSDLYRKG